MKKRTLYYLAIGLGAFLAMRALRALMTALDVPQGFQTAFVMVGLVLCAAALAVFGPRPRPPGPPDEDEA